MMLLKSYQGRPIFLHLVSQRRDANTGKDIRSIGLCRYNADLARWN